MIFCVLAGGDDQVSARPLLAAYRDFNGLVAGGT
jgi:hypothetical protein